MYHIVDLLSQRPILSALDIANTFGVTHQTAIRGLQRLVKMGILQKLDDRQRYQRFAALKILEIVQR